MAVTGSAPGPVSFETNGTNSSRTTTAHFKTPGTYRFLVTITNQSGFTATDTVDVEVRQNLELWQNRYFTKDELTRSEVSGPSSDPDADGFANLLEYGLGLDPRSADPWSRMPVAGKSEGLLSLTFQRPRPCPPDLTYEAQVSGNLSTWSSVPFSAEPVDNHDGTESLSATDNLAQPGSPRRFIRLKIILPSP